MAYPIFGKSRDKGTRALHMLALETIVLAIPIGSPSLDEPSKDRLRAIVQKSRTQGKGLDPDLFARVLESKTYEWAAHLATFGPHAVHPTFAGIDGILDEALKEDMKRERIVTLVRLVTEIVVLEWSVINAGLGRGAIWAIVTTIDMCWIFARGIHAVEGEKSFEEVFQEKRREWVGFWMEWASLDEGGRIEYGVLSGADAETGDMVVGRVVVVERTEDGEDALVETGLLAKRVEAEYDRVRAEVLGWDVAAQMDELISGVQP